MMNEIYVVDLLKATDNISIAFWIGGGWGVDALIGTQTRPHDDIDVYINKKDGGLFEKMLHEKGYSEVVMEYTTDEHTVWRDLSDHAVDLHLLEVGTDEIHFAGYTFPVSVLDGEGVIGGFALKCFTADAQLLFHQGYEYGEKDIHNVMMLCKTFGFEIPAEYQTVIN
jgi:lincosamide nucleotidyltransferase A/C/D/E